MSYDDHFEKKVSLQIPPRKFQSTPKTREKRTKNIKTFLYQQFHRNRRVQHKTSVLALEIKGPNCRQKINCYTPMLHRVYRGPKKITYRIRRSQLSSHISSALRLLARAKTLPCSVTLDPKSPHCIQYSWLLS